MFALFKACPRQDSNLRHRLYESLQALLVVVPKGVLNWRYNAIRHQPKPRRVADSPTKHRPQIDVGFRTRKPGKPWNGRQVFVTPVPSHNRRTVAGLQATATHLAPLPQQADPDG